MEHCKAQKLRRIKVLRMETKGADSAEEENCMGRE